jgi:hypothetical protein
MDMPTTITGAGDGELSIPRTFAPRLRCIVLFVRYRGVSGFKQANRQRRSIETGGSTSPTPTINAPANTPDFKAIQPDAARSHERDHRGGGRGSFHSAHRRPPPPVHRFVRGLRSSAAGAALDDRRPVGGASSYRAAAAVASIFFASRVRSPIRASHRRDDSVSREEPHVLFVRVAFALKGPDISAQGKATRVVRASPSPWVAYHCGEKALKGRDNRCIGLCRPFRASGPIRHHHPGRRYTLPRADLSRPLQGTPPQPGRFRTLAGSTVPTASGRTPNEPGDGER